MPEPTFFLNPEKPTVSVSLEPAFNILQSLMLLYKADHLSGLGEWVTRTKAQLTPEQDFKNKLVLYGLHYAVVPDRSWPTFEDYIEHLEKLDPIELRNRTLDSYAKLQMDGDQHVSHKPEGSIRDLDLDHILKSADSFLTFLSERFPQEAIDTELESEAYRYLMDPPAMQRMVVAHLRDMWNNIAAQEWNQVKGMLQNAVIAFGQVDFQSLTKTEAMCQVTGQDPEKCQKHNLDQFEHIVFIPSAHVGPYFGKFNDGKTLWLLFGARNPEGAQEHLPDLSRAEILVRVTALADDNRLRILRLIHEEGEQRSKEIMSKLELSQSATSRHLKQLSATGLLVERRCTGAKCYKLNPERIEDTLSAISLFLLGS